MAVLVEGAPLRRGDIVAVDLDLARGAEFKNGLGSEVRSCIVVQNDRGNAVSPTTVVVPLSDAEKNQRILPILVFLTSDELGPGGKDSVAHCEQVRTIDVAARVKRRVGRIGLNALARIDKAISISLGL